MCKITDKVLLAHCTYFLVIIKWNILGFFTVHCPFFTETTLLKLEIYLVDCEKQEFSVI